MSLYSGQKPHQISMYSEEIVQFEWEKYRYKARFTHARFRDGLGTNI